MKNKVLNRFSGHLLWMLLFGSLIVLSFNKHSRVENFTYQSELWADKGGYYIYLPASIIHNFDLYSLPDSIDSKLGNGFKINHENQKIITKYYYGVTLLWLPFFLTSHFLAPHLGYEANGFSTPYFKFLNISGAFYASIALLMLFLLLNKTLSKRISFFSILLIFGASNAFYYTIDENGMTHIYSFFMYTAIVFFWEKYLKSKNLWNLTLVGIFSGILILTRPTHLIFLPFAFLAMSQNYEDIKTRIKALLNLKSAVFIGLSSIIFSIPQLIYWKYTKGDSLNYSYENEGFTNWLNPKIIEQWFDPYNGLIPYSPVYLVILIASVYMILKHKNFLPMLLLLLSSYVFSSWWNPQYGCSFGQRNFVDLLPLFLFMLIPFAKYLSKLKEKSKYTILSLLLVSVFYTIKLSYSYDECYFGDLGDWSYYFELIKK